MITEIGLPPHTPPSLYVDERSSHSGTLSVLPACSGACEDWPMSSSPGPAVGLTYTETSCVSAGVHLFLTVTGTFAQCVASAVSAPVFATLRMLA